MPIPIMYAALIPTMFSTFVTAIYLSGTKQKFFNQYDTIERNASKLGHNFKTLITGTCGSFFLTTTFQEDKYFSILHVLYYAILIEFFWYCFHRSFHENKWLYRKIHKLHHHAVVTMPVDAYIMSVPEVLSLTLCFAAPAYVIDVSQSSALVVTSFYATVGLLEHGAMPGYRFHDYHHLSQNCNYGYFLPVFDYLFGTYKAP
jgi:sterol desaturase/sphingolipid hydroxylase (fatty acid hydroxylase superfamily)